MPPAAASSALFRRLRAASREVAGVQWYEPSDAVATAGVFPPTLRHAVADLDRSAPPYLRCEHCGVKLARGLQSTVCVFCGTEPRREFPTSVSFSSTAAYRNLLESLGLDGSELVVTPNVTSIDSSNAKDLSVEEVALSSFFDIELKWPREERKDESSSSSQAFPPNTQFLNLSGVDLDNFFSEANAADAPGDPIASQQSSHEDAFLPKKVQDSSESRGIDDFDNLRSPKTLASAEISESKFDDSFGDWEAGFQSSGSVNSVSVPILTDLFDGPSKSESLQEQIDSNEGVTSQQQQSDIGLGKPSEGDIFPTDDSSQDDIWQSADVDERSSAVPENAVTHDVDNNPMHESDTGHSKPPEDDKGRISSTDDWTEDNLWQSADVNVPSSVNGKDGKTDGMATSLPHLSNTVHTKPHEDDEGHIYHADDWTQDDLWQSAESGVPSSSSANQTDTVTYGFVDNDLWQGGGPGMSVSVDKVDGDPFDVWQDFTSSHGASGILLDSLPGNVVKNTFSNEAAGEKNSTSTLEDMEFCDFLQFDCFPGVSSVQHNSLNLDNMQFSSFDSFDVKTSIHSNAMLMGNESGYRSATAVPQSDSSSQSSVEAFLSQIPDLSFMLESNLCIPKTASS